MGIVSISQRSTAWIAHKFGCGCQTSDADFAVTVTAGSAIEGPGPPDWRCPGNGGHASTRRAVLLC
jgi:hypothetical protein